MSERFRERDVGDTIRFESELFSTLPFKDEENLTDADNISVNIEKRDGSKVVDDATPVEHEEGLYFYEWDTVGLEATQYKVSVFVRQGDAEQETSAFIELVD